MSTSERLDRLEASHVRLMTEHEILFREYEVFIGKHQEWLREYDARCERDREDRKDLDRRISELVSGVGQLIREGR